MDNKPDNRSAIEKAISKMDRSEQQHRHTSDPITQASKTTVTALPVSPPRSAVKREHTGRGDAATTILQ